jgi:hypothetical protein
MVESSPTLEELRYPIGPYYRPATYTADDLTKWIATIEALPLWLDVCIENLDAHQLDTPYRPGGWTMIQTIHHIADSHMNAFIRLKLALTEDSPTIKPYDEAMWAETPEIAMVPVNVSITLLHALHRRWATLLKGLGETDWQRAYYHPEQQREFPIWDMTAMYAWHSRHHMEHLRRLRERMGW